jgi:peroxiredoxin
LLVVGVTIGGALQDGAMAVEVGQKAPDFKLPATTGGTISLAQFRGKQPVLIEFYGADFSPVWADNLSARKAEFDQFKALGVQIIAISADHQFSQKAFADSLKPPFPLLSDDTLAVARSYGVLYGHTPGKIAYPHMKDRISKRYFFLVDREGTVRGKWLGEDLATFPSDTLLKAARALVGQK